MDDLTGVFITVLSGVLVYILSQLFTEFILRPIQDYKKLKGKVAKELVFYAHYYSNPQKIGTAQDFPAWKAAGEAMRELASEVSAFAEIKPLYPFAFYAIPTKKRLLDAARHLMGMSNDFFISGDGHSRDRLSYPEIIKKNMGITHKKRKKK